MLSRANYLLWCVTAAFEAVSIRRRVFALQQPFFALQHSMYISGRVRKMTQTACRHQNYKQTKLAIELLQLYSTKSACFMQGYQQFKKRAGAVKRRTSNLTAATGNSTADSTYCV